MTGGAVVRVALAGVAGWLTLAVVVFPPDSHPEHQDQTRAKIILLGVLRHVENSGCGR